MAKVSATSVHKIKEVLKVFGLFLILIAVDFCMILLTIKFFGRTPNFTSFF